MNSYYSNKIVYKPWGYEYVIYCDSNFLAITFLIVKNLKDKKFKIEKLEFILLGWFLVEVLALMITGPRFWNYGINLILPTLLIFIYFFSKYVLNCCLEGAYFSIYAKLKFFISSTVTSKVFFLFFIGIIFFYNII